MKQKTTVKAKSFFLVLTDETVYVYTKAPRVTKKQERYLAVEGHYTYDESMDSTYIEPEYSKRTVFSVPTSRAMTNVCYSGFTRATGVKLEPGVVVKVKLAL